METMYRQGDLLFIKTESSPKGERQSSRVVLGSSVTGHNHEITDGAVYVNEPTWSDRASFYVEIPSGGAELIHPEHKTIGLSSGVYKVIRQREVNGYVKD